MTVRLRRLTRTLPRLTLEERFDAVLAAYREDRRPVTSFSLLLAEEDRPRWNRLIGLLDATHRQLGWYVNYVEATVTQVELRFGILLGLQLAHLHEEEKLWNLALDPEAEEQRASTRSRMEDLKGEVKALAAVVALQVAWRWQEVRLAEIAALSLQDECSGRDILHPETRATLDDCRERLLALRERLAEWAPVELEEPEDAAAERLLELLEQEAGR